MKLVEKIRIWYRGRYVPPPKSEPGDPFVIVSPGHYEQPRLAKALEAVAQFWLQHWKWLIGTLIALIGVWVAIQGAVK